MDTEMDVELLNIIKYTTKDDRKRCLLRFRPVSDSARSSSDKFKGLSVIDCYYDGFEVFDKIPIEYFGVKTKVLFKKVFNPNNPLKQTLRLVKVNDIDLV